MLIFFCTPRLKSGVDLLNYEPTWTIDAAVMLVFPIGEYDSDKLVNTASREYHIAKRMSAYFDAESKPFIHLIDGGVSDNLGGRGPTEIASLLGGNKGFENIALEQQHHLAIIMECCPRLTGFF